MVADRLVHERMLIFTAHYSIAPIMTLYFTTTDGIDTALRDFREDSVRYQAVSILQTVDQRAKAGLDAE